MYNRKNASDETAVEITCYGACDGANCPCVCPKNGCRCQATNCHTDGNCTEVH
jgi:hypothetical protein